MGKNHCSNCLEDCAYCESGGNDDLSAQLASMTAQRNAAMKIANERDTQLQATEKQVEALTRQLDLIKHNAAEFSARVVRGTGDVVIKELADLTAKIRRLRSAIELAFTEISSLVPLDQDATEAARILSEALK